MADQNPIELTASDQFNFAAHVFSARGRRRGAIVVCPDAFGVIPDVLAAAQSFADEGFDVIVPQLLDRSERNLSLPYDAPGIARGSGLASRLGYDKPLLDITAAIRAVSPHSPVAIVGFSWGASVAYVAAANLPNIACAVCYYGAEIVKLLNKIPTVPVLMHFAQRDATISKNNIDLIRHRNPAAVVHSYPAQHGFIAPQRSSYDAPAAKEARERTLSFINENLTAPEPTRGAGRDKPTRAASKATSRTKRS